MNARHQHNKLARGDVVTHRVWNTTGTVVRRRGSSLFVAWHNSFVEDELGLDDVELLSNPTAEQKAWRGGFGILTIDADAVDNILSTGISLNGEPATHRKAEGDL